MTVEKLQKICRFLQNAQILEVVPETHALKKRAISTNNSIVSYSMTKVDVFGGVAMGLGQSKQLSPESARH